MLHQLANMTWKNPIFMLVFFAVIWYLPGILLRNRREFLAEQKKEELRKSKLERLYPNEKDINQNN